MWLKSGLKDSINSTYYLFSLNSIFGKVLFYCNPLNKHVNTLVFKLVMI